MPSGAARWRAWGGLLLALALAGALLAILLTRGERADEGPSESLPESGVPPDASMRGGGRGAEEDLGPRLSAAADAEVPAVAARPGDRIAPITVVVEPATSLPQDAFTWFLSHAQPERAAPERAAKVVWTEAGAVEVAVDDASPHSLRVEVVGYATTHFVGVVSGARLVLRLEKGGVLRGKVLGVDGAPQHGAAVLARNRAIGRLGGSVLAGGQTAVETSSDGSFELTGLRPGLYDVQARGTEGSRSAIQAVLVTPNGEVTLHLESGLRIEGIVEDAATGVPVSGAGIHRWLSQEPLALTNAQGEFTLRLPSTGGGARSLWARKTGYAPARELVQFDGARVRFALERGRKVTGALADSSVLSAVVRLLPVAEGGNVLDDARVKCEAGQRFGVADVTLSNRMCVIVTGADGRVVGSIHDTPGAGDVDLGTLAIGEARLAVVRGSVVGPGQGATVTLKPTREGGWSSLLESLLAGDLARTVLTDADGRFAFPAVQPGRWLVEIDAPGWPVRTSEVTVGHTDVEVGFSLPRATELVVRVSDAQGRRLNDVIVSFESTSGAQADLVWTGDGTYTLRGGRGDGGETIRVRPTRQQVLPGSNASSWVIPCPAGTTELEVRFPGPTDIGGYLTGGEAPLGGQVRISGRTRDHLLGSVTLQGGSWILPVRDASLPVDLQVEYLGADGKTVHGVEIVPGVASGDHCVTVPPHRR